MQIVINQLCHIFDRSKSEYYVGRVNEIYDEYIVIKKKLGGNCRIPINEIDSETVKFLHKEGQPVIIERGFWGYRYP